MLFTILWSIFVYSPIAHWVWASDGWLYKLGTLDFAGGTVVHATSGVSALVVALLIGHRAVNGDRREPHDIPMTVLGAGLLWFGWFGFNAGSVAGRQRPRSERAAGHQHGGRRRDDHLGPRELHPQGQGQRRRCSLRRRRGAGRDHARLRVRDRRWRAGHRAVAVGMICYSATLLRERLRVDDALDVFAVHGVGGTFGAIATGVFATTAINAAGRGLIDGNPGQVVTQTLAVGATISYAVVATFVIVKVVDVVLGLRVRAEQEEVGLDLSVHGEVAYQV